MGVSVRVFAHWTALVALIAATAAAPVRVATGAQASTRPRVALLNVAADQAAGQRAVRALRRALLADDQFDPLQPGPLANVLELAMSPDPHAATDTAIARADERIAAAREALSNLEETEAHRQLKLAERTLVMLEPTAPVIERLAEINFQIGLVHMRRQDSVSAAAAFRIAMRLAPSRPPPDPGVYSPDIIDAYRAAASLPQAKTATVRVVAPFDGADVYIDGIRVGVTPYTATIEPGAHYFWGTMADKQAFGARLTALVDEPREVSLLIRRIPDDQIAARVRRKLLSAETRDDDALREATAIIYQLTLVKYVLVVTDRPRGELTVSVFDAAGDRLTAWAELSERSAAHVIHALPGRVVLHPRPLPAAPDAGAAQPIALPPSRPWYREPLSYVAVGGGTLLVAIGVMILTSSSSAPAERIGGACCDFAP